MAIELHLQKTNKTPWGFRLAGGAEYEVPLTVIKVTEGSIAENAGMQEGDVVVRINDIPTTGLAHPQAHDALLEAGNDFVLAVRRGDLSHLPPRLLLYETSVQNAEDVSSNKSEDGESNDKDLNITDEEIVNIIGEQVHLSTQKALEKSNIEVLEKSNIEAVEKSHIEICETSAMYKRSEVAEIVLSEESQKTEEKKWSTFLQKPKNPKPKLKVKEPVGPKAPQYRVIIKKQPKKGQEAPNEPLSKDEEQADSEIVSKNEENLDNDMEEIKSEPDIIENTNERDEELDENANCGINEDESMEIEENEEESVEEQNIPEESEERRASFSEKRSSINLEEQLAQVQQQLLALSQLPSAIQQTLNAVTQQLSEIVSAKLTQEQEITIEANATVQEEIVEEHFNELEEHEEKALSILEEEHYEEGTREETEEEAVENIRNESEDEQALFEALEKEIEEEEQRRQEELEAQRIEQERLEKKDKEKRPSQPLTPLERPIILPGGRKWSQPDDAVSKIRRPSMTDEKIANTINPFSEVNHWNNIWPWSDAEKPVYRINFLKYQPPPKNLDYLQKSAVYRLVHDIEPPPKGIIARDIKVLAEQDYYADKQEHENLPTQMER